MSATKQQFADDLGIEADTDSDIVEQAMEKDVPHDELEAALKEYIEESRDLGEDVETYEACTYTNTTYCSTCSGSACEDC
jgi:hypothetical protein